MEEQKDEYLELIEAKKESAINELERLAMNESREKYILSKGELMAQVQAYADCIIQYKLYMKRKSFNGKQ